MGQVSAFDMEGTIIGGVSNIEAPNLGGEGERDLEGGEDQAPIEEKR